MHALVSEAGAMDIENFNEIDQLWALLSSTEHMVASTTRRR